jgi:hypothetical protein
MPESLPSPGDWRECGRRLEVPSFPVQSGERRRIAMPSLFRFLIVLVILGLLGGAAMIYLAFFVGPNTREMTVRIPADKLAPR